MIFLAWVALLALAQAHQPDETCALQVVRPRKRRCTGAVPFQRLRQPPERRSPLTLVVGTAELCDVETIGNPQFWHTRAYGAKGGGGRDVEPGVPGPTIRVKPGEDLIIHVENTLKHPTPSCSETGKWANVETLFCRINTTNLHTHGLHVCPRKGGDDVFEDFKPGTTTKFNVSLPKNHASGTFWYHPHKHHSTAGQAGGGMHGTIIVDDPDGLLPPEYSNMREVVVVLTCIDMRLDEGDESNVPILNTGAGPSEIERESMGHLWKNQTGGYVDRDAVYVLTNGQWVPRMEIRDGEWIRFRFVYATVELTLVLHALELVKHNGFSCELQLIAKDGVYLPTIPRLIKRVYLPSGGRADVAVRCTCGHPWGCLGSIASTPELGPGRGSGGSKRVAPSEQQHDAAMKDGEYLPPWWDDKPGSRLRRSKSGPFANLGQDTVQQEVLRIVVLPSKLFPGAQQPLPRKHVPKPCYLADLRGVHVRPENKGVLSLPAPGPPTSPAWQVIYWSSYDKPTRYRGLPMRVEKLTWPLRTVEVGTVQEFRFNGPPTGANASNPAFTIGGLQAHPLHIHVGQYQIQWLRCSNGTWVGPYPPQGCYPDEYFKTGDWHDTLMQAGGQAITRMVMSEFTGHYVIHCHILAHEDNGMMAYYEVKGKEGTAWKGAKRADPHCYCGKFGASELLENGACIDVVSTES